MKLSIAMSRVGLMSFDPERRELRMTAVTMAAVLASFGSMLVLEHSAHLHFDIVIEAIVLARIGARVQRRAEMTDRIAGLAVLSIAAVVASEISRLMSTHPFIGDSFFVLGMFGSVWVRRFGPHATKAGTLMVAPFVANLVLHGQDTPVSEQTAPLWAALVALIAYCWVFACQALAAGTGFGEPLRRAAAIPPAQGPSTPPHPRRLYVSTRMALQMAASLAAAFIVGRTVWPGHWTWVVLTAFIVCSGARGRGDVAFKGFLRGVGAMIGTIIGIEIAGLFGPHADVSIVLMFVVLAVATWLRELSYACWAAGVTTMLSLLYGWLGEPSRHMLPIRLESIAVGAIVGIVASWLILPVKTRDVLRRRSAEALAALGGMLGDSWQNPTTLEQHQKMFNDLTDRLEQIARPLRAHRSLLSRLQPDRTYQADAIDAIRRCAQPMGVIIRAVENKNTPKADPRIALLVNAVAANVTAVRRAIARRPGIPYQSTATLELSTNKTGHANRGEASCTQDKLITALKGIDSALGDLSEIFKSSPSKNATGRGVSSATWRHSKVDIRRIC